MELVAKLLLKKSRDRKTFFIKKKDKDWHQSCSQDGAASCSRAFQNNNHTRSFLKMHVPTIVVGEGGPHSNFVFSGPFLSVQTASADDERRSSANNLHVGRDLQVATTVGHGHVAGAARDNCHVGSGRTGSILQATCDVNQI